MCIRDRPRTVRGLVASGVSHLTAVERRLLQVASVFGMRAHDDQLREASELDAATFQSAHEALVGYGVLEAAAPHETRFTSELLHDVLYEALTPAVRAGLHRAVGEALEAHADGHLPMLAERIAHHYRQAGEKARAEAVLAKAK